MQQIVTKLPSWTEHKLRESLVYPTHSDKMGFVLDLAAAQIEYGTGYPFSAAIFDRDHRAVKVAVNSSTMLNNSTAHAEMLAIQLLEFSLGKPYLPKSGQYTLAASGQPCAMCIGAIYSSGLSELIIGARESDIVEIMGFGQGPVHPQWREFLEAKKITITEDVDRERARSVLKLYKEHQAVPSEPPSRNLN